MCPAFIYIREPHRAFYRYTNVWGLKVFMWFPFKLSQSELGLCTCRTAGSRVPTLSGTSQPDRAQRVQEEAKLPMLSSNPCTAGHAGSQRRTVSPPRLTTAVRERAATEGC